MPRGKTTNRFAPFSRWRMIAGLTGGLGSGKSTVLAHFKKRRIFTVDADEIVHDLLARNRAVKRGLVKNFGSRCLTAKGKVDRSHLAKIVFSSPRQRRKLEKLIHPIVRREMKKKLMEKKGDLAVLDIPLLFESGWTSRLDQTIVVWTSLSRRLVRLKKRGVSAAEARRRFKAQISLSIKRKKADHVINNSGSLAATRKQVDGLIQKLKKNLS